MDVSATVSLLQALGDPTRVRLLALLSDEELTVAELTAITELPQSRVSTHLGKLKDSGFLRDRRDGSSSYYALNEGAMPKQAADVWQVLHGELGDALLTADRERREQLLRQRGARWPDSIAGEMERHYSPGRTWEAAARGLLGLVALGDVLDVGSGDGVIAQLIVGCCRTVTLLDSSEKLIQAAERRLADHGNAAFARGDMQAMPFDAERFDVVLMFNVLTYAEDPAQALHEALRVLRPGGQLALVTLNAHRHENLTKSYGHRQPGFAPQALSAMLRGAGFEVLSSNVTSRERKKPHFEVVSAFGRKPAASNSSPVSTDDQ